MKKILFVLLVVFMSVLSWQLSAQSNATTVADGTATNEHVPIYGWYCDDYVSAQIIYPESMLSDLVGATISQIDFYLSTPSSSALTSNFNVKLGRASADYFATAALDAATNTTVYTGLLNMTGSVMTIPLTSPFTYTGGNLLLEVSSTTEGVFSNTFFYGIFSSGASIAGNSSFYPVSSYSLYDFIPKTTFTFTGGATCLSPTDLVVSNITSNSADISFSPRDGALSFELCCVTPETDLSTVVWTSIYDTFYSVQNLSATTSYKVYVRTNCGSETSGSTITTFTTPCVPIAIADLPYNESFESYSIGSSSPISPCWHRYETPYGFYPYVHTDAAHNSNNGFCFADYNDSYVALPLFEENLTNLQISFYQKAGYSYYVGENFYVGVMTDPNDVSTFETVYAGQITSDWTLVEVPLSSYLGTGKYIAVRTPSFMYTDDYVVNYIPSCLTPSHLVATDISNNSITLSWIENGTATAWNLTCMSSADTTTTQVFSNQNYEVSNLNAGTTYAFELNADCGSETSNSIFGSFTTLPAVPATIPYTCDFEDATEVNNWFFANDTYTNQWVIDTAANNTIAGTKAMYISNDNGASNAYSNGSPSYVWAYRDVYFTPAAEYTLSFDWKCNGEYSFGNYYDYLQVFIGDPIVPNGDVIPSGITAISSEMSQNNIWQTAQHILNSSYSGTTKRIYFYWVNDYSGGDNVPAIIDNIQITAVDCGSPFDVVTSNVSATDADIHWNAAFDADSQWEVVYDTLGFDPNQAIASSVYDTTTTLEYLNANTTYQVYVRTNCGNGSTSNWSNVCTFTTTCASEMAPYIEDFSSFSPFPNCWKRFSGLASSTTTMTSDLFSVSDGWFFNNNNVFGAGHGKVNIYGNYCNYWLVSPIIDLNNISSPTMTFDLALTDYDNVNPIEYPDNVADDKFIVFVSTDNGISWNMSDATVWDNDATSAHQFNQISSTGESVTIDLSQYAGQNVVVAFYVESTVHNGDNDLHIDNLYIGEVASCAKPSDIVVEATTCSSVTISWTENGTATTWNVEYGTPYFTLGTGATIQANDTFVTISNLTGNTDYQFYVQADCGGETSNWSTSTVVAHTLCDATSIPYTENFDSYQNYASPVCWTSLGTYVSPYLDCSFPYITDTYASAPYGLYFYNGTASTYCMIATPEIDNSININDLEMTFNYFSNSSSSIMEIGVLSDVSDASSFVALDTLVGLVGAYDAWAEQTINFSNYIGTGHYIAFKFYGSSYPTAYLDDVDIHFVPSCPKPADFVASTSDLTSVTLSWNEVGSAMAWNVEYGPSNFIQGTGITVSATTNPFVVTGLSASTSYDFYVQATCGTDEASMWVGPVSFATLCDIHNMPFVEDFNAISSGIPACWNNDDGTTVNNSFKWNYYENGYEGSGVRFNSYVNANGNTNTLKTPIINIVSGATLSFYYKNPEGGDFSVYVDVDGTQTLLEGGLTYMSSWTRKSYDLSTYTNQNVQIAFMGTSNYGYDDAYIYLDSVAIVSTATPPAPCDAPTDLTVANVTANSVMLSWTENGTATSWTVNYKEDGVSTWSTVTANTTTYTLSGLNVTTPYSAYVIANCADDSSDPSNTVTFTTLSDGSGIEAYELSTTLYPNPNNGQFTIRNAQFTMNSVSVYDVYGKLLMTVEVNGNEATIDATAFANGMYFARIATEKGVVTKSFVKK